MKLYKAQQELFSKMDCECIFEAYSSHKMILYSINIKRGIKKR